MIGKLVLTATVPMMACAGGNINNEIQIGQRMEQSVCENTADCSFVRDNVTYLVFEDIVVARATCDADQLPYGIRVNDTDYEIANKLASSNSSLWNRGEISLEVYEGISSFAADDAYIEIDRTRDSLCYKESLFYF